MASSPLTIQASGSLLIICSLSKVKYIQSQAQADGPLLSSMGLLSPFFLDLSNEAIFTMHIKVFSWRQYTSSYRPDALIMNSNSSNTSETELSNFCKKKINIDILLGTQKVCSRHGDLVLAGCCHRGVPL